MAPQIKYQDIMFCAGNENGINWSCDGDSGSPLVKIIHPTSGDPYYKLVGILHGSKSNCDVRPRTEPSLFANLETTQNFFFIQRNQPVNKFNKILVATGWPYDDGRKVEVIDLDNPSKTCIMSSDFPYKLNRAVGGFTSSGPMVCSGSYGSSYSAECYSLRSNGQFVQINDLTMNTPRDDASSIVTEDGKMMISGGYGGGYLADTEIINVPESKTEDGFELPFGIEEHCSVLINSTTVMVLGGHGVGSTLNSTHFINLETLQVTTGPEMQQARRMLGCAVFEHNQQSFVIASGGYPYKDLTEFLNLDSKILRWSRGPSLPVEMGAFPLVSTSKGILAVGGSDYTNSR